MYCKTHNSYSNACGCGHSNVTGDEVKQKATDLLDTVKEGAVDIFDAVKSTGGFILEETKEGVEDLKEKAEEFDEKPRLVSPIKNSVLVYGAIGILIYALVK